MGPGRVSTILYALLFASAMSPGFGASSDDLEACFHAKDQASVSACTAVINANPSVQDLADAYYSRALVESDNGDQNAALADYTSAIRTDPKHDYALHNRAMIYDERGNYELAIADFNDLIAVNPIPGHFFNRARAYLHDGQFRRSTDDYTVAYALLISVPDFAAYALAGRCFALAARDVDLDDAAQDCETAVALHASDPMFLTTRAFLKLRRGDRAGAVSDANAALAQSADAWKEKPQNPILEVGAADAFYVRGLAECGLKQTDACTDDINAAVRGLASIKAKYARYGVTEPLPNVRP